MFELSIVVIFIIFLFVIVPIGFVFIFFLGVYKKVNKCSNETEELDV
jgi:hypothetical protein